MVRPFIFSCTDYLGHTRHVGAAPFPGGSLFSLHRPSGVYEPRKRVRP